MNNLGKNVLTLGFLRFQNLRILKPSPERRNSSSRNRSTREISKLYLKSVCIARATRPIPLL